MGMEICLCVCPFAYVLQILSVNWIIQNIGICSVYPDRRQHRLDSDIVPSHIFHIGSVFDPEDCRFVRLLNTIGVVHEDGPDQEHHKH